jgi:acetoacetyl-CoA synthetase
MAGDRIWEPSKSQQESAKIADYTAWLARERGLAFADYDALWNWSVTDLEAFWQSIWEYFEVRSATPYTRVLSGRKMPGARWFEGATVNYVDQVFRHSTAARDAIVFENEKGLRSQLSWSELERQVASLAASLRGLGVAPGDRVVAYLPNIPETVVAFLACASVGAVWSVCSPDMGPVSVLDRFRQIAPCVLIACDGYQYGGKEHDRREVVRELLRELKTVKTMVLVPYLDLRIEAATFRDTVLWSSLTGDAVPLSYEWLPFDHPLWIVYSSGTTGMPKPIVHGHGGIVLEGLKGGALHNDLGAEDRFCWYSSTGWIMWNSQVGGLLGGATLCIYDGNPGWPDWTTMWKFVGRNQVTFFGAGAAFYAASLKAGIEPRDEADLSCLRALGATGSPLSPECYRWIFEKVGPEVWLAVIAGGTDFAGAFLAGNITLPIYIGEMQCRSLGAAVYAYSEAGQPVVEEVGELVCTEPIPSMPLYFWNDPDQERYRESYFDVYPGVWRHGDWLRITARGGGIIYGRSDATINRHGIRMGTSELYRAVEALPEILDSLVVDLEYLGRPSYMPLFVVMRPGFVLDESMRERIVSQIRQALSARHVPNDIHQVSEVPRTLSGKKLELPIKRLLLGQPVENVVNRGAMGNPASLDWFIAFASSLNEPGDTGEP